MQRLRSRLRPLASPAFAKVSLFLATAFLFTVIHQIGSDTLDPFRLATLLGIDVSNVTYSPGDRAALSTILSGLLLINTLPGLKSNGNQTDDLKFLDFAISALAITLTFSIGWNWLTDETQLSQQSPLSHILPILSFTLASILFLFFVGVLGFIFYAIIRISRILLRWSSRPLGKLTPRFHQRKPSPQRQSAAKLRSSLMERSAETWQQNWLATWKRAWVTHAYAATAVAVFAVSEGSGSREKAIEVLGLHPDRTWTFLPHAVMHTDWLHLALNVIILEIAGPFVEKRFRWPFYLLGIILITITGAQLATKMAAQDWNTGPNPVGMSISTRGILAVGIYLGVQNLISDKRHRINQLARNARREAASWAAAAFAAAISIALLWAMVDLEGTAVGIGHTTGAVGGLLLATGNAIWRTCQDGETEERDDEPSEAING